MKTLIFLPTLNEKENIEKIIRDILALSQVDIDILVVDDSSQDGTIDIVKSIMEKEKTVHLLVREKKPGRGYAGIAAFRWFLEKDYQAILEMDADFSHDPIYIPALIGTLDKYDIAIGSRHIEGGKDTRPYFPRQLVTMLAGFYIRTVLGLPARDITSGFRAFKREVVKKMPLDLFISKGPSILQEQLYAAHKQGFKIGEVPITFVDRSLGTTKLNLKKLFSCLFVNGGIRIRDIH